MSTVETQKQDTLHSLFHPINLDKSIPFIIRTRKKSRKQSKTKVNALPLCALECEDGRVFSDINDRKLMSVFGRDQGATF